MDNTMNAAIQLCIMKHLVDSNIKWQRSIARYVNVSIDINQLWLECKRLLSPDESDHILIWNKKSYASEIFEGKEVGYYIYLSQLAQLSRLKSLEAKDNRIIRIQTDWLSNFHIGIFRRREGSGRLWLHYFKNEEDNVTIEDTMKSNFWQAKNVLEKSDKDQYCICIFTYIKNSCWAFHEAINVYYLLYNFDIFEGIPTNMLNLCKE